MRILARLTDGEPLLVLVLVALVLEPLVANRRVAAVAPVRPPRKRAEE